MHKFYNIYRHHLDSLFNDELHGMIANGMIAEHPYYKYVMGDGYFANLTPARKGVCTPRQLSRVFYTVEEHNGSVAMSAFVERLDGLLTQKQTRTLIGKLCDCGYLQQRDKGKNTRYGIIAEP